MEFVTIPFFMTWSLYFLVASTCVFLSLLSIQAIFRSIQFRHTLKAVEKSLKKEVEKENKDV